MTETQRPADVHPDFAPVVERVQLAVWALVRPLVEQLNRQAAELERLRAAAPVAADPAAEPPIGGVVIDADGLAWQRSSDGYWKTHTGRSNGWPYMTATFGPVTPLAPAPVAADLSAARDRVRAYLQATDDYYVRRDLLAGLTNSHGRFELRRADLEALVGPWTPATPTTDTSSREG